MKKNYLLLVFFIGVLGYSQTVDSNGAKTIKITNPPIIQPISLAFDRVHVSANGRNDGQIFINTPSGGTPYATGNAYTISWTNINNANEVVNPEKLFAGTYKVTVTDSKGCFVNETYEIIQPPLLVPGYTGVATDICFGSETELTATAEGGFLTANGDYKYRWMITYLDNFTEIKNGKI